MKEENKDLMGIIDEVPFNCIIEDVFVIKMLSFDFDTMIEVSTDVVRALEKLSIDIHFIGGVANTSEEVFYEVEIEKIDDNNVVIKDIFFIELDDYLDHITRKNTIKYFTDEKL
jgi:hypothetical protein